MFQSLNKLLHLMEVNIKKNKVNYSHHDFKIKQHQYRRQFTISYSLLYITFGEGSSLLTPFIFQWPSLKGFSRLLFHFFHYKTMLEIESTDCQRKHVLRRSEKQQVKDWSGLLLLRTYQFVGDINTSNHINYLTSDDVFRQKITESPTSPCTKGPF